MLSPLFLTSAYIIKQSKGNNHSSLSRWQRCFGDPEAEWKTDFLQAGTEVSVVMLILKKRINLNFRCTNYVMFFSQCKQQKHKHKDSLLHISVYFNFNPTSRACVQNQIQKHIEVLIKQKFVLIQMLTVTMVQLKTQLVGHFTLWLVLTAIF